MKGAKLGQHFLTRPQTAGWVAGSIPIPGEYTVLEIGPGHGILTRELLKTAKKVVAIEKDTTLVSELKETFREELESGQLVLISEDVRDFTPSECAHLQNGYVLIANIPYYITGYIMRKFLTAEHQPTSMVLLVQKEVAERAVAKDGKHSLLSLSVHVYGNPSLGKIVRAGAFSPPPKVDSAILIIQNISRTHFSNEEVEKRFFEILKTAFSQKRKTLGATLKTTIQPDDFVRCALDKKTRPEDVFLEQWLCLAENY